jgi:hypothetical protein
VSLLPPAQSPEQGPSPVPTQAAPAPAATAAADSGSACKDDWRQCKDNSDLVNNFKDYYKVQYECQRKATDEAEYGTPVWPGFWSGGAFGNYRTASDYVSTGITTAVEPNAQFQNAFGAMVHSTVVCEYDLKTMKVMDVAIIPH